LKLRWQPSDAIIQESARQIFLDDVFGTDADYGPDLLRLMIYHHSKEWDLRALKEQDIARANALEAFTGLTRMRLAGVRSLPALNLQFAERAPQLAFLAVPMSVKIPVISFQYFLDVHVAFAFNSIRRASHLYADDLIAYLYELLFLQQKIAISLNEFVRLAAFSGEKKDKALLINAEVTAIIWADSVFSYLKASIEKTIAFAGLTFGAKDLDSKKTHKAKMDALVKVLPQTLRNTSYGSFFSEYVKSEYLEELNNYRSGLLHKKGIADLQPHNYVSVNAQKLPLLNIFSVMHEQHAKNTGLLVSALALLTDKLVESDPPAVSFAEIMEGFKPSRDESGETGAVGAG
jgi:hypothetical protein